MMAELGLDAERFLAAGGRLDVEQWSAPVGWAAER